jgi:hypothetical protein
MSAPVVTFNITTSGAGAYTSTGQGDATVSGLPRTAGPHLLYAVEWVDTDFDAGVDAVLSVTDTPTAIDKTLLTLTNADAEDIIYPRVLADDNTATALTSEYAMQVVYGTLKLAVTNGGATKTGKCVVYLIEY